MRRGRLGMPPLRFYEAFFKIAADFCRLGLLVGNRAMRGELVEGKEDGRGRREEKKRSQAVFGLSGSGFLSRLLRGSFGGRA